MEFQDNIEEIRFIFKIDDNQSKKTTINSNKTSQQPPLTRDEI